MQRILLSFIGDRDPVDFNFLEQDSVDKEVTILRYVDS